MFHAACDMSTRFDFVLTSEAARIVGVSAQSIRQWERLGRLAATRTASGVRLFARADVEELRRSLKQARALKNTGRIEALPTTDKGRHRAQKGGGAGTATHSFPSTGTKP